MCDIWSVRREAIPDPYFVHSLITGMFFFLIGVVFLFDENKFSSEIFSVQILVPIGKVRSQYIMVLISIFSYK